MGSVPNDIIVGGRRRRRTEEEEDDHHHHDPGSSSIIDNNHRRFYDNHHGSSSDHPEFAFLHRITIEKNNSMMQSRSVVTCPVVHSADEPLIIIYNNSDQEDGLLCSRDASTLISNSNTNNEPSTFSDNTTGGGGGVGAELSDTTNPIFGTMMIVNAALGAGLLNFPSSFHDAGGILAGNLVQFVMLLFIYPALLSLAFCSDWNKAKTLQEVMLHAWGRRSERVTATCVALYCFGTCITFLIIMGDQFDRIFASLYGPYFCHTWYLNRTSTTIATGLLFVLPFCYSKEIGFLKHISSLGVFSVIYVAILIIIQYYRGNYTPGEIRTSPNSWTDVFLVVPSLCFSYQCHVSVIPIYSCYKKRNMKSFAGTSFVAIVLCAAIYTLAASFGYLTFGSKISSDILESYDANDPLVLIAIVAILIKTYSTYPILSFCGNAAIQDMWVDSQIGSVLQVDSQSRERFRLICVSIWFTLTLIVAVFMPNIGSVIKLLGSLAAIFIFIFPGMCFLRMAESPNGVTFYRKPGTLLQICAAVFLGVGGFLFGVVATNAVIYDFIYAGEGDDAEPICLPLNRTLNNLLYYY